MAYTTPAREYTPGMGQAVADRTINRKILREVLPYTKTIHLPRQDDTALDDQVAQWCKSNGYAHSGYLVTHGDGEDVEIELTIAGEVQVERWEDVAYRVALGNSYLHPASAGVAPEGQALADLALARTKELDRLHHHLRQATLLMSGRHLQHGDATQPSRPQEVFTNCATAAASFLSFYLLLNGSGVGRCYDDDMMAVDYNQLPITVCVCDSEHADVQAGLFTVLDLKGALHLYGHGGRQVEIFEVPDSREGWAKAVEKMELMAYVGKHRDTVLLLDFSKVRPKGSPIKGMQDRPASGPGPLISAINNVAKLREVRMEPWRAALYADHYLAECVLVGGARRAARMATKSWRDKNVLGFIGVKRGGFLWSANNSVTVDEEFWKLVMADLAEVERHESKKTVALAKHAKAVFEAVCRAAYYDGTGEPGFINVDRLTYKDEGTDSLFDGDFAHSARYQVDEDTRDLMQALVNRWMTKDYKVIVNPCGEIVLIMLGGYCVIADTVPFHAVLAAWERDDGGEVSELMQYADYQAEDVMRVATRALMRTNLMDSLYGKEVKRTNRIGVGMTGIHEYAFARFGYGWKDLVDEDKSKPFWLMLSRFKRAVKDEARRYAAELGVTVPHTDTTIKPAGTTSKLFGLTEGAHLPTMREFLRWVQFRNGDPLIEEYRAKGYPVRELRIYHGTTIVGFPTKPTICELGMGDKLVTAAEATPEEQYQWLRLLEKYWIVGVEEDGVTPLAESGNQVSYTLKYDPAKVSFEEFKRTLLEGQSTIRCCSVMPQTDTSAYEYLPEQPVSKHEYEAIAAAIDSAGALKEDVGFEHVDCAGGACPISFGENEASQ